jgi:hypothetical protein
VLVKVVKSKLNGYKFEYPVYTTDMTNAFFQLLAAWFLICMFILMWFHIPPVVFADNNRGNWHAFFLLGFVGWGLVVISSAILGVLYSIQAIVDWFRGKSRRNRKPTLLSIYIKAFKEKHCPKINIVD